MTPAARLLILLLPATLLPLPAAHADGPDAAASSEAVTALTAWLREPEERRVPLPRAAFASVPLTKAGAAEAARVLWDDHAARIRRERAAEIEARVIELGALRMKFEMVKFEPKDGPPPAGRSLFLSLHGGGGAPTALNDSQWRNQVKLAAAYRPAEGIYVAPRAPTDTWNLWHEAHIDQFFARLIEDLIVLENVNANRVYVLGYSAGGDGVHQLAPRMADRFAAAAMMAGHPNEASPLGLRNIGFCIQTGANDGAYHRNEVAAEWGRKLDALQKADPDGYAHFAELHAGKGHWMDLEDRKAIPWLEKFTRNPGPAKIVWHQDDVTHAQFYWLAVPEAEARVGTDIVATRTGQDITVNAPAAGRVSVRLSDALLDLDRPVQVVRDGKPAFSGTAARTIATLATTLAERGDPGLVFSAEVNLPAPPK